MDLLIPNPMDGSHTQFNLELIAESSRLFQDLSIAIVPSRPPADKSRFLPQVQQFGI
jgi:hypothetical protein